MAEVETPSYTQRDGWEPAFEVQYKFVPEDQGGRTAPPLQHLRWDFMYEGDDPLVDGISMVWPEFISELGAVRPEGEVPTSGRALMFIVDPKRVPHHRSRIAIGVRGYFMEGSRKVAHCEVTAVLSLAVPSAA